jgi:hypothetical protein
MNQTKNRYEQSDSIVVMIVSALVVFAMIGVFSVFGALVYFIDKVI